MRVTFLGTGTSHGVPMIGCSCAVCTSPDRRDKRRRPSIYVEADNGAKLLVDTGPDLRAQALEFGVVRVDAILFTHGHADHVVGLDEIRRYNALQGGSIPCYADARTRDEIQRMFSYVFDPATPKGGGIPDIEFISIEGPFEAAGTPITPVPVYHGERVVQGFRVGRFAYLTDCSRIPRESWRLLEGVDVVVLDALRERPHPTHFSLTEAVAAAERIGARQTLFTHIAHDLSHERTCARLPSSMALAYDGQTVEL
ncbi:MAG: MBL fold metallo-hydrolase [Acidobacteriota bacterium]